MLLQRIFQNENIDELKYDKLEIYSEPKIYNNLHFRRMSWWIEIAFYLQI